MALMINRKMKKEAERRLEEILEKEDILFSELKPSMIPEREGVYVISHNSGEAYYVGRSTNLRNRLYRNHLMGPLSNARLKYHLVAGGVVDDEQEAKEFMQDNCKVRWILEQEFRKRGALESYFTALFFPRYGISRERRG